MKVTVEDVFQFLFGDCPDRAAGHKRLLGRALSEQAAAANHQDPIRQGKHLGDVVRDIDHRNGEVVAHARQIRQDFFLEADIERGQAARRAAAAAGATRSRGQARRAALRRRKVWSPAGPGDERSREFRARVPCRCLWRRQRERCARRRREYFAAPKGAGTTRPPGARSRCFCAAVKD